MTAARISILTVDEDAISPLKFRGWLRNEAIDIQRTARDPHDVIVIRLYMTDRYRYAVKQAALDKMLKAVVDKHPNIWRVELEVLDKSLTVSEVLGAARAAQDDLDAFQGSIEEPSSPTKH